MKKYFFMLCIYTLSIKSYDLLFKAIIDKNEKEVLQSMNDKQKDGSLNDKNARHYIYMAGCFSTPQIFQAIASANIMHLMDVDQNGNTIFHELATCRHDFDDFTGKCEITKNLIEKDLKLNFVNFLNILNDKGETAIDIVTKSFDLQRVNKLLALGAIVPRKFFIQYVKESAGEKFGRIFKSNMNSSEKISIFYTVFNNAKQIINSVKKASHDYVPVADGTVKDGNNQVKRIKYIIKS